MRDPPSPARPRAWRQGRWLDFPRGASCCLRQRFAPPLTTVRYAWTPVCIGLYGLQTNLACYHRFASASRRSICRDTGLLLFLSVQRVCPAFGLLFFIG